MLGGFEDFIVAAYLAHLLTGIRLEDLQFISFRITFL
jgi:hypothetical protein